MSKPTTGFGEAQEWVAANAPGWRLVRGEGRLLPGMAYGDPTRQAFSVVLTHSMTIGYDVSVEGSGASYIEAVKNALGGLLAKRTQP